MKNDYVCGECKIEPVTPVDPFCWQCRDTIEIYPDVEIDRFPYARKQVVFRHINHCFTLIASDDGWEIVIEELIDCYEDGHWTEITFEEITIDDAIKILATPHNCG